MHNVDLIKELEKRNISIRQKEVMDVPEFSSLIEQQSKKLKEPKSKRKPCTCKT